MATNPAVNPDDPLEGLLAAVARGDRSAFAELYAATSAQLLALLLRNLVYQPDGLVGLSRWVREQAHQSDLGG